MNSIALFTMRPWPQTEKCKNHFGGVIFPVFTQKNDLEKVWKQNKSVKPWGFAFENSGQSSRENEVKLLIKRKMAKKTLFEGLELVCVEKWSYNFDLGT